MALVDGSYDSLPYIDAEPSQSERDAAHRLVMAELPAGDTQHLHSSLSDLPDFKISSSMQTELDRIAGGEPMEGGIDSSRYEAPDEPSIDAEGEEWRSALRAIYASHEFLFDRHINLTLLDQFGKNAWLIGNSQLEDLLKSMETGLARLKEETDNVNKERKSAQENSRGEIVGLEEAWKTSVDKIIEVQVATDGVRQEILARRRAQAH